MKRFLISLVVLLNLIPSMARNFSYTHEGQTLTYTVTSETNKTVETMEGRASYPGYPGNYVSGNLIIPSVVMDENNVKYTVTSIGWGAFLNCYELKSVSIPPSVTIIFNAAFRGCKNLSSVTFPHSVTSIGQGAFEGCYSLTSVEIGNSVTHIGCHAFLDCYSLKKVVIYDVAAWCNIDYDGSYSDFYANPLSYAHNLYLGDNLITDLEIPEGVSAIKHGAFFGGSCLKSVTIPNSVTSIGSNAFEGCTGLTSAEIGNSVTSIGDMAFKGCTGLKKVVISDVAAWCNIDYNRSYSDFYANPLSYAHNLYLGDNLITDLEIPEGVSAIKHGAFFGGSCLKSVIIPNSVTSMGSSVFEGCTSLIKSAYPSTISNPFYGTDGNGNITSYYGTAIKYPADGAIIDNGCVWGADKSALYFVPLDVKGEFIIPNSVTSIGTSAFEGCTSLTSVIIPRFVTQIGNFAFHECSGLTKSAYPSTISQNPFYTGIAIKYDAVDYRIEDGVIYTRKKDKIYFASLNFEGVYNAPETVKIIGENAFTWCNGITLVGLNDNLTTIEDGAFANCSGLTSLTLNENLTSIGKSAFANCSGLTTLTLNENLTSIGKSAFANCSGLKSLTLNESLTSVDESAFANCSSISTLTLNESLTSIGVSAFANCSGLTTLTLNDNLTSIGVSAFNNCSNLKSVILSQNLTSIGSNAFSGCKAIDEVQNPAIEPIDAPTTIFENEVYDKATLYVPFHSIEKYESKSPWNHFYDICGKYFTSGIVEAGINGDIPCEVYNVNGLKVGDSVEGLAHGIYIVRQGTVVKKIIVR